MNKLKKLFYCLFNDRRTIKIVLLSRIAKFYSDEKFLKKLFKLRMGYELNLDNPQTFNEKLQWLKLYNRKPEYTQMVDKYEAKKYVANIIGEEYIIPTIGVWDRVEDIDFDKLPNQFVLKCTHDSGGLVICRDKSKLDISAARKKINKFLKRNYYWENREWPYKNVKPRIIAEQYITIPNNNSTQLSECNEIDTQTLQAKFGLLDYKFMCFDGVVKALFLDIGVIGSSSGHAEDYYRNIYDREWKAMPLKETRDFYPTPIRKPDYYEEMIAIAEKLSKGIPHLRVDLYYVENRIYVGELTFFHGSGLSNYFDPEEWNYTFGSWIDLPNKMVKSI